MQTTTIYQRAEKHILHSNIFSSIFSHFAHHLQMNSRQMLRLQFGVNAQFGGAFFCCNECKIITIILSIETTSSCAHPKQMTFSKLSILLDPLITYSNAVSPSSIIFR
uniref:Uncharacterized protein n=1 Tax=Ditylum brightwellii TaxID=49249 RepID=A0A7S4R9S9_9STRA